MLVKRMLARDPNEPHRVSTPLELLFDLCFVVAVAEAAAHLHHAMADGHITAHELATYAKVFFAIWWAWMSFTWFASAYDCDDVPYRISVLVQIAGVLVIAAGVPPAFEHDDYRIMTFGYALMRVSIIRLWLRAGLANPEHRRAAYRYALGTAIAEVGWIAVLLLPRDIIPYAWLVGVPIEIAVPIWAEQGSGTPWHPHHIAERYGLLTLIVIGESVLSATTAIQASVESAQFSASVLGLIAGGILIMFSMWWLYFAQAERRDLRSTTQVFGWAYGHYVLFAATAAVGAGLAAESDSELGIGHDEVSGLMLAVPVALFLVCVWALEVRPRRRLLDFAFALGIAAVFVASLLGAAVFAIGVVMAVLVAITVVLTQPKV